MNKNEIKLLRYFTEKEITATGAKIEDVQSRTMFTLVTVRKIVALPIYLLKDGLTTGAHATDENVHARGEAVDFTCPKLPHINTMIQAMLNAGFRGVGYYINSMGVVSFHGDLREKFTLWKATGKDIDGRWIYQPMIP